MKKKYLITLIIVLSLFTNIDTFSQNKYQVAISAHYVSFGSGDLIGMGVSPSFQVETIKNPKSGLAGLKIGAEVNIDIGNKGAIVTGISPAELSQNYSNILMNNMWLKASYYPFNKYLTGFYVALGPTIGYKSQIWGSKYEIIEHPRTGIMQKKIIDLQHEKGFNYGYRISLGYDFLLNQNKLLIGLRADFFNNNLGDINSTLGLKFGYNFAK